MKKFNLIWVIGIFFLNACQLNAEPSISWKADGTVKSSAGKFEQLEITGIYAQATLADNLFLAGFKLDSEGNNTPEIARVSSDLSNIKYWALPYIANDIFAYQQSAHLVATNGDVFKLEQDFWVKTELTFPADARAVYSDGKDDLIICYPVALEKTVVQQSGCKSLKYNWQLDFVWQTLTPKVCEGKLYLIEQTQQQNIFKQVDLSTGKTLAARPVNSIPADLCKL